MTEIKTVTASVLIIGNEVLSGRTKDANLNFMARRLAELGIKLAEARVIPDVEPVIVDAINETRRKYDYVFTTGGIGPTHDDITSACVAKAFGVGVIRHPEAVALLKSYIPPDRLNEARLKMADVPDGAELIHNPVSRAPGFRMGNVFVMAGVPSIMRAMFDGFAPLLVGGDKVLSRAVACYLPEGTVAQGLSDIQDRHPEVDIGSYPFFHAGKFGTTLISRSANTKSLDAVVEQIHALVVSCGGEPIDHDIVSPDKESDDDGGSDGTIPPTTARK
jgi:molybdenum cofactor synthesis domain-containing protein